MRNIDELIRDADAIVAGRAQAKTAAAAPPVPETETQKLAAQLRASQPPAAVKLAALPGLAGILEAVGVVDTLINLPVLAKMDAIEKQALEAGHSEEKVAEFFEKHASQFQVRSVLELVDWSALGL